jgi:uncharacterized protein YbcI
MTSEPAEQVAAQKQEIPAVARISRDIVRIHARLHDHGPTKAKTLWREEIVVCVMEEVFTTAERMLVDGGRFDLVREQRMAFHDKAGPLLRRAVEMATGRYVDSFLGQVDEEGVAVMAFVLGEDAGSLYEDADDGG